jgi:hypothetical protein
MLTAFADSHSRLCEMCWILLNSALPRLDLVWDS